MKKKLLEVFIIYFPQSKFIKSMLLLSPLNLQVLHFSLTNKKVLNVTELLLETESTNSKREAVTLNVLYVQNRFLIKRLEKKKKKL